MREKVVEWSGDFQLEKEEVEILIECFQSLLDVYGIISKVDISMAANFIRRNFQVFKMMEGNEDMAEADSRYMKEFKGKVLITPSDRTPLEQEIALTISAPRIRRLIPKIMGETRRLLEKLREDEDVAWDSGTEIEALQKFESICAERLLNP